MAPKRSGGIRKRVDDVLRTVDISTSPVRPPQYLSSPHTPPGLSSAHDSPSRYHYDAGSGLETAYAHYAATAKNKPKQKAKAPSAPKAKKKARPSPKKKARPS